MKFRTLLLLAAVAAVTYVVAAPRTDAVCILQQAWHANEPAYDDWSCMHYAAQRGDHDVVERMLDFGAAADQRTSQGSTPLQLAAENGHLKTVKLLLHKGANINAQDTDTGASALHLAAVRKHPAVVRYLVAQGADVSTRNRWKQTPLWQVSWQTWHGNTEIAHILVAQGADVQTADHQGNTPLHMAARAGHTEMIRYLIDQGADIDAYNDKGRSPLFLAAIGNQLESARMLLNSGAAVDATGSNFTPLRAALNDGHTAMARLLQHHGADDYEHLAAQARLNQGWNLYERQEYDQAIQAFADAIRMNPEGAQGYYYRGLAWEKFGNHQEARRDLEKALSLDPDDTRAMEWLAWVTAKLGDHRSAIDLFNRLIEQRPDYGKAWYNRAKSLLAIGERKQAEQGIEQACELGYDLGCIKLSEIKP